MCSKRSRALALPPDAARPGPLGPAAPAVLQPHRLALLCRQHVGNRGRRADVQVGEPLLQLGDRGCEVADTACIAFVSEQLALQRLSCELKLVIDRRRLIAFGAMQIRDLRALLVRQFQRREPGARAPATHPLAASGHRHSAAAHHAGPAAELRPAAPALLWPEPSARSHPPPRALLRLADCLGRATGLLGILLARLRADECGAGRYRRHRESNSDQSACHDYLTDLLDCSRPAMLRNQRWFHAVVTDDPMTR